MRNGSAPADAMNGMSAVVESAAREVLTMTAGLEVTGVENPAVPGAAFDGFVANLSIVGTRGGTLVVYCEPPVAIAITAGMTGTEGSECDDETVRDALGELVNQIAGTIKRGLGGGTDMVITCPVVIAGAQMHHYVRSTAEPIAVELGHEGNRLFVCLWPIN